MPGKKFRFSLESVLTLRTYETEQARQRLGMVLVDRQKQEEEVQRTRETLSDLAQEVPAEGVVKPAQLRRHDAFRLDAQHAHEAACSRLHTLQQREAQARAAVRGRHGAEETMRLLKDNEYVAYQKEQDDAERAFLDEQATFGFNRRLRRPVR